MSCIVRYKGFIGCLKENSIIFALNHFNIHLRVSFINFPFQTNLRDPDLSLE